jgi:hypothetical protein
MAEPPTARTHARLPVRAADVLFPGSREGDNRRQRRKWPEASVTLTDTMKLGPRLAGPVHAQYTAAAAQESARRGRVIGASRPR